MKWTITSHIENQLIFIIDFTSKSSINLTILLLDIFGFYFLWIIQIGTAFDFYYFATEKIMHLALLPFAMLILSPMELDKKSICFINKVRFFSQSDLPLTHYDSLHLSWGCVKFHSWIIMSKFYIIVSIIKPTCSIHSQLYFALEMSIDSISSANHEHTTDGRMMTYLLCINRAAINNALISFSQYRIERFLHFYVSNCKA